MAFWNAGQIYNINEGAQPNDGTGDTVRDAFIKVDDNFANISTFLAQPTVQFLNANVEQDLTADSAFFSNLEVNSTVSNTTTVENLTANIVAVSNITVGNILPSVGTVDLGSITNPFRNLYYQNLVSSGVTQTVDAGQFVVHANAAVGDTRDVGILGNVTHHYAGANTYAFFGYQYQTNNFVYKITNTDPTKGNAVVYDGIYGGAQLGGLYLSNTTVSTTTTSGALTVAGGAGIAGNINVGGNITASGGATFTGNITSGGYQVLTTNMPGVTTLYPTTLIAGNAVVTSTTPSVSPSTGALVLSFGGAGIAGDVNAGGNVTAAGLVGPYYGTIQTTSQPNITSIGTLGNLNVTNSTATGSLSATSVGTQNLTVTGTANFSGATVAGIQTLNIIGNLSAGNITSTLYGSVVGATGIYSGNVSANYFNGNLAAANGLSYNSVIQTINTNVSSVTTAWTSNAATQQGTIDGLTSNAASQQGQIITLQGQVYANANVANYLPIYSGNIAGGNLTVGAGTITVGNIVAHGNLIGNIGSSSNRFNTIFAKATSAQYADLAERYIADAEYAPGTVVVFGGEKEITTTTIHGDARIAGAISTHPAYLMNALAEGLPIALRGRIPVKVIGAVRKGDSLVTSTTPGYAISVGTELTWGQAVFAKSLETNLDPGEKTIEAVIL